MYMSAIIIFGFTVDSSLTWENHNIDMSNHAYWNLEGGAASRIGFEPLFVCNDDG